MSNRASDFLQVRQCDITVLEVDAIVNAANERMLGGGGVDGAIHHAAGPKLLAACRAIPELQPGVRCPTGACRITPGFDLPAAFILHTVGPVWHGGSRGEAALLAACYKGCLDIARAHRLRSVAFPAISCGVFGFPLEAASRLSVAVLRDWQEHHSDGPQVTLAAFSVEVAQAWEAQLAAS